MRLKHNMYDDFDCRLFGLRQNQMRMDDFVHNGGWYNSQGEKIGWGDLSPNDIVRLSQELEDGEDFYVLGEQDSYWNFVKWAKTNGEVSASISPDATNPGIKYVNEKARYLIQRGKFTTFVPSYYSLAEISRITNYYQKKFSTVNLTIEIKVKDEKNS